MLKVRGWILILLLPIISLSNAFCRNSVIDSRIDSISSEMSQDETILFNMINDFRVQSKLPIIPLSKNLCSVARIHINDLIVFQPQEKGCGLHSWSESGNWTACCHAKDPAGIQCMKLKPGELTSYPGYGYELIYWGEDNATPTDASTLWKMTEASSDMILCKGKWKGFQWKAVGVGIRDGYAVLWIGDKTDNSQILQLAEKGVAKTKSAANTNKGENSKNQEVNPDKTNDFAQNNTGSGIKYYLIVSSVKNIESAQKELKRLNQKLYPNARIVKCDGVFRIAVDGYDSEKQAKAKLNDLKNDFPGIWIFKQ